MAQSVKPADVGVSVGQVLEGKYRVDAILGHGGMGVVAECTHLALNERVAIKLLRQDVLLDHDAVSRFVREAQAAVKLKSEYVARVSDVGRFANGTPYMVMEYLEGYDLGELLKQRGVLPVQWTVELMLQTAEALCEAHSLGIVHRDVKPTNLFVTWRPDGSALIKVLDFGISKSPMGTDMQLTQTQSLLGTPAYMSPEQMRSARLVDHRTDIWSLGTVFYESLEGRRPFEAESFSEMCVKVAVDPPEQMVNTPPALQHVILRCLAKAHDQRYPSMAEFARDLVPFAADPHGAQVLVDRMTRMLKRSAYDWESGSTGVGRQALPTAVADISSAAIRATPVPSEWGVGSDPAGRAWMTPVPRGDASQPVRQQLARRLSTIPEDGGVAGPTLADKRRSRLPLILGGMLLAGAAAFGAIKLTSSPDDSEHGAEQVDGDAADSITEIDLPGRASAGVTPPEPGTPITGSASADAGDAGSASADVTPPEPGTPIAGSASASGHPVPNDSTIKADVEGSSARPEAKLTTKTKTATGNKTPGKSSKTGATAKGGGAKASEAKASEAKAVKPPAAGSAAPLVEDTKPEPPKCDPFGSRRGCK